MSERRPALALACLVAVAVAVSPPVDAATGDDLVWHMAQHLVLLVVAAPLGVLATMPRWRTSARPLGLPAVAALSILHVVVVTGWHVPALFDAAERHLAVHVAEHLSFLAASAALWWAAGLGRRPAPPVAVVAVFVASLPGIALGAAMTLSTSPWYASYPSIVEQQVAGALMWSIGGAATVLCGALCVARAVGGVEVAT